MLPHGICEEGLYYPMDDGLEAELDALVIFDRYAFIIEGKAGSKTRGTKADSFKATLGDIVGHASKQAFRAQAYIQHSESPRFRRRDGTLIEIDKSRVNSFVAIAVSLESLDVFTSELSELRSILSLKEETWAISLTDLREIAEIISWSSEFTHYLRWRLGVGNRRDVFGDRDEMNWLGIYLKNGPTAPTPPAGFDILTFTSHTEDFDNYFMHKLGDRDRPAPRPSQHLPQPLPLLVDAIERSGVFSFTEAAEALLDCTFPERDSLARLIGEFGFESSKGRAKNITFEAAQWVFMIYPIELAPVDLRHVASEMVLEKGKPTIAMTVHAGEEWRVIAWVIEKHPLTY